MNPPAITDPEAITRLQRLGGDAFVVKMIDLFQSFVGTKIDEALQSQRSGGAGNLDSVERAAHAIKSTAGNIGAFRVQELAFATEQAAKQSNATAVAMLLPQLEQAYAEANTQLVAEKARLTSKTS